MPDDTDQQLREKLEKFVEGSAETAVEGAEAHRSHGAGVSHSPGRADRDPWGGTPVHRDEEVISGNEQRGETKEPGNRS